MIFWVLAVVALLLLTFWLPIRYDVGPWKIVAMYGAFFAVVALCETMLGQIALREAGRPRGGSVLINTEPFPWCEDGRTKKLVN